MATLIEVYAAKAENSILRNRTASAIAKAAWAIIEKNPADTADRIAWAKTAIETAESIANSWMWAVVGNVTVQAANFNPTDGDLEYIVATLISVYAGAAAA